VLELEHNPDQSADIISEHIAAIEAQSQNPTIVLGCAGMTNIHGQLQARHEAVLIDPIMAAARLMPALL
jgi:Asp/Glu/hydantoin racemase